MDLDTFVVAYLHSPRERWWGLLRGLTPAGITLRGISIDSFDSWMRSIVRNEEEIAVSSVFFPMIRVERIYEDETTAATPSHSDRFREATGIDARSHLRAT
jgi:hypothetical protein